MLENYSGVLEPQHCKELISSFEDNVELHEKIENLGIKFTQLNLTEHELSGGLQNLVYTKIVMVTERYRSKYKYLPSLNCLEQFRIKKYEPVEDVFDWHVDVVNRATAKRFLAIQFYLNTVDEGGKTFFQVGEEHTVIDPVEGSVLCFPPTPMFPHCGQSTVSEPKYILTTYLHYAD